MRRIFTLPITPQPHCSFLRHYTAFYADVIGKLMGCSTSIIANTVGMKSDREADAEFQGYRNSIRQLGIACDTDHDGSEGYRNYFAGWLRALIEKQLVRQERQKIVWCSCGRVEMPLIAANAILRQERQKSLLRGSTITDARCVLCGSTLEAAHEEILTIQMMPRLVERFVPSLYRAQLTSVRDLISSRPAIVSRNHRETAFRVGTGPFAANIDTDFYWTAFPMYLCSADDVATVISSPTTLHQLLRIAACANLLDDGPSIEFIIHPLVRLVESSDFVSSFFTTDQLLEKATSVLALRMFMALGINWTAQETLLQSRELYWAMMTARSLQLPSTPAARRTAGLEDLPLVFNRLELHNAYKAIRAGTLQLSHEGLIQAIAPLS